MQNKSLINRNKVEDALGTVTCVLLCLLLVFAVSWVFFAVNYFAVKVDGISMEGTLHDGDFIYAFVSSNPRRGNIVVIDTGELDINGNKKIIIKRVIALGGDTVELKSGVLYLNGEKVDEPYVESARRDDTNLKVDIPEGHMFFMGDNRRDSEDCRTSYDHKMVVSNIIGIVADWSLPVKGAVTAINNLFDYKKADTGR